MGDGGSFTFVESTVPVKDLDQRKDVFFTAVVTGNAVRLQECIDAGVNVNMLNIDGIPALHILACRSDYDATRLLFSVPNVDKNIRSTHTFTPLHIACLTSTDPYYIYFLLENNVNVNAADRLGKRPIQYSVEKDSLQVVQWLLDFNAEVNFADDLGNSPLSISILDRKNFDMARLLLKYEADPNFDRGTGTHLYFDCILSCMCERSFKNLLLLLKYNVNPKIIHPHTKKNALHYAAIGGYKPCIKELLKWNISLVAQDIAGKTPADIAKEHCHYEVLAMFVEHLENEELERLFKDIDYNIMKNFLDARKHHQHHHKDQ